MPAQLSGVLGEANYKAFSHKVNEVIAGPGSELQQNGKRSGIVFAVMLGTFFVGFISGPLTVMLNVPLFNLFFLPFLVWPPCFMLIFSLACKSQAALERLETELRDELNRQSSQYSGVTFHLREGSQVVYGNRRSHTVTERWIEASFSGGGGGGGGFGTWFGGGASPNGYTQVAGVDVSERLANLESLKQRMLITDSEYQAKRMELLSAV
eukprot:CAMPEP_0204531200 /NCGR_PEP_ID=MMETSP0661-20131031/11039_1 /ASSEMBLY_ACC=CAM_ASM_000606 /TAXON_ID=109239 /ORGANISM="Alexandrium margalefi, Strain AMGDE01CS-322" /LENGTH=209 /DNA_ID=CAMNT_0051537341 /DNA_START=231 /DNA_END=860 /DNA_ORIENTATION=+